MASRRIQVSFLLPCAAIFLLFFAAPLGAVVVGALAGGLGAFRHLFADPLFWRGLGGSLILGTTAPLASVAIGFGVALHLSRLPDGRRTALQFVIALPLTFSGLIVAYGYVFEFFMAFYSGNQYDRFAIMNRLHGPYAAIYYSLWFCNIIIPQALWFKSVRNNVFVLFVISLIVNTGMWLERFVIVVISLHRDFLPSSWGMYYPTRWDWATFLGTIGLFLTLIFLFMRVLPAISMNEMRVLVDETDPKKHRH